MPRYAHARVENGNLVIESATGIVRTVTGPISEDDAVGGAIVRNHTVGPGTERVTDQYSSVEQPANRATSYPVALHSS